MCIAAGKEPEFDINHILGYDALSWQ